MKKLLLSLAIVFSSLFLISTNASAAETTQTTLTEGASTDNYTVDGTTLTVNVSDASLVGPRIEAALAYAKNFATDSAPITVVVPAGDYTFYDTDGSVMTYGMYGLNSANYSTLKDEKIANFRGLHIYSNTRLVATGCTFRLSDSASKATRFIEFGYTDDVAGNLKYISYNGVVNYNYTSSNSGYNGFKNITIDGGTWVGSSSLSDTPFKLYHATNVSVKNLTLKSSAAKHMVEAAAMKSFYVTGCTFSDSTYKRVLAERAEAFQLDVSCNKEAMTTGYNDGTANTGVYVSGNTFTNLLDGFGTHSMLVGSYHTNIIIENNKFTTIKGYAINGVAYENAKIQKNVIQDCEEGIYLRSFITPSSSGVSDTIFSHIFDKETAYSGSTSYNGNVSVVDNVVATTGNAIEVAGCVVATNTYTAEGSLIPQANYYYANVNVTGNTVVSNSYCFIISDVYNATVSSNVMAGNTSATNAVGIAVTDYSVSPQISGNTIYNLGAKGTGIYVGNGSMVGYVASNIITANGSATTSCKSGITVTGSAQVIGAIQGNTIKYPANRAIYVTNKAHANAITGNAISNSAANGIQISSAMVSQASITDNKILSIKKYGIYITGAPTNKTITISGNRIRGLSNGYSAIYTGACKFKVLNNKISKYGFGIRTTASTKGSIYENSFSSVTHQLYLAGTNTYDINYKKSKLSAPSLSAGDNAFTANWNQSGFVATNGSSYGVQKYVIAYSTSKKFTASKTDVTKSKGTSKTVSDLKSSKKYYVTMQGLSKFNGVKVYTATSSVAKVKTK